MKPPPFRYEAPNSLEEALSLLRQHGSDAKLLAGGQSLIPLLNFRLARPAVLIDLNRIGELDFLSQGSEGPLRVGAMVRQSRLERDSLVAERAPLVAEAMPFIAHEQIRNRGTLGGALAHADPAAELPAVAVALEARLRARDGSRERWLAADEFFVGLLTTALSPEEILVEVEFPSLRPGQGWAFAEAARRHGDYALAGVAIRLTVDPAGACRDARIVLLGAGDGPVRARRAAARLEGERPVGPVVEEAVKIATEEEIEPAGDIHASAPFKRHLCAVLTRRALEAAVRRARDRGESASRRGST